MTSNVSLPPYYVIEPTDYCNFRCSICPHSQTWDNKQHGLMDLSLFRNIISQIADYAKVIQLYWMGEPLICSSIYKMIAICKRRTSAKVLISTNGSLLTQENVAKLVNVGIDEIIVSVDACCDQKIYEQIRVGGDLFALNSNIEYLIKNKWNIHVVLQFIDMYVNKQEKEAFIAKWKDWDCDIDISCLYSWSNQLPWLNSASDNLSPVRNKPRIPCADLWNKMVIHWNGDVPACCFDYNSKILLGNCYVSKLGDIWNSEAASTLRKSHISKEYDERLCRQCDSWAEPDEYDEMFHL